MLKSLVFKLQHLLDYSENQNWIHINFVISFYHKQLRIYFCKEILLISVVSMIVQKTVTIVIMAYQTWQSHASLNLTELKDM